MSKRKPIRVLDKEFRTKKDFEEYMRRLRDSHRADEFLLDEEFEFMMAALARHENFDEIVGDGIAKIMVRLVLPYGNHLGFFPVRLDGSVDAGNFSFLKCVDTPKPAALARKAFRDEIANDVAEFKRSAFTNGLVVCSVTRAPVRTEEAIVHHDPRFSVLRDSFLSKNNLKLEQIRIKHVGGFYLFEDEPLRLAWRAWHTAHARLSIVSRAGHEEIHGGARP